MLESGATVLMKLGRFGKRAVKRLLHRDTKPLPPPIQVFSIGIFAGDSPLNLHPATNIPNPVITAQSVSDARAVFVADPFMIKRGAVWCMFFEVLNAATGRGEIGLACSTDALHWKYERIVLREPFHLSYPYVFEWNHEYYLVPESYEANSIRLYKAVDFPTSWTFAGDLIVGGDFEDSSLFRFGDRWWLITDHAQQPYYAGTLRLFYAQDLMGPWTEHPKSPIIDGDPHIARPAGRVLILDGRAVRFTQDCRPVYGARVRAFEFTELTTTSFQERQVGAGPVLQGSGDGWNASGMHHLDAHFADGRWIACVDGWHWEAPASSRRNGASKA